LGRHQCAMRPLASRRRESRCLYQNPRRTRACRRRLTASAPLPLSAAPDAWRSVPETTKDKPQDNNPNQHHKGQDKHPGQHTKTHKDKGREPDHPSPQQRQCQPAKRQWEPVHPGAGEGPPGRRLRTGRRAKGGRGSATAKRWLHAAPNKAVERTGHTAGFFQVWVSVGCGPPLTAGVRRCHQTGRKACFG
jgi:hypothetical protein